ncbi:hypothetical protein FPOA_05063 [Fusarium poae]|uniref:Uncharacterized protein n=1 Tax=Fusarium poae TaxID=36050 RepID=A0A1B8AVI0_FUSPO|nr:hypothetical protein FPOA_05063 [Fusarium poae]
MMPETQTKPNSGASFSERMSKLKKIFQSSKLVDRKEVPSSVNSSTYLPRRSFSIAQYAKANSNQEVQLDYRSVNDDSETPSRTMQQHIIKTRQSTPALHQSGKHDEESRDHTIRDFQLMPFTAIASISEQQTLLQRRLTDPDGTITNFKKQYDDLKRQLIDKCNEVRQLQDDNEILKRQCSEAATKTYHPKVQLPLNRPESELIKDWHTLVYSVNNFVDNHFRDVNYKRIASWAKIQQDHLREVAERPQDIVTNLESGLALIKATVWHALRKFTFGGVASEGAMCWAGRYKGDLRRLAIKLEVDNVVEGFLPLNYQWKTLTTNMISILQTSEQRGQEVEHVVMDIDDLLAPCRPRMPRSNHYHRDLQTLVSKAIEMDLFLSGETTAYFIKWPISGHLNVKFDQFSMMLAVGSPPVSRNLVRFVIQPGLYRADRQGDSYNSSNLLDKSRVWMS